MGKFDRMHDAMPLDFIQRFFNATAVTLKKQEPGRALPFPNSQGFAMIKHGRTASPIEKGFEREACQPDVQIVKFF
jgi:hypothetical protein